MIPDRLVEETMHFKAVDNTAHCGSRTGKAQSV
jgi:hypothetical protein